VALVAINQFGTYMDHLVLDREPAEEYVVTAVSGPLLMLAVVWWGSSIRLHRERQSERVEQATRQERLLRLEAERALAQERLEIARELHDLVAHHVSGMVLQAAAAQRGSGTAQADEALGRIRHSGVAALAAMREVLGLLRADPDEAGDPQAPRHPQPRLADVQALVADSRAAGAAVHLTVTGRPRQLPDSLELCAYRIVQEALTNAARHAPGGEVRIRLDHQPAALDIRVDSDAEGPAASHLTAVPTPQDAVPQRLGSGLGLTGMRERVVAAGGQLQVGPTETGWVVHARLPTLEVPAHLAG
jgi:signal transduction histidine kinase